ncbi:hypothetical protein BRD00_03145 [Halobacteriales archaeon QS_8_69_26]|nr:MAG: hypothetical protein BRD00_03145 [Halobacteriales archaeon QS_8_69_26]
MPGRRTLAAAALVCLLAASAGCGGLFASEVPDDSLDKEPPQPYDWETNGTAKIYVVDGGDRYQAVFDLSEANTTKFVLYERGLSTDRPEWVRSVRYRYPNGTEVNGSHPTVDVRLEGSRRVVEAPRAEGKLAFTGPSDIKQFGFRTPVDGSYELVLPPGRRVGSFLFGRVSPNGYSTSVDDQNRLHVTWEEVNSPIYVRYYLLRDLLIFRGGVAVLVVVAGAGVAYYLRKIRTLKRRREEIGLDVESDEDDEFDRDPPPGMK